MGLGTGMVAGAGAGAVRLQLSSLPEPRARPRPHLTPTQPTTLHYAPPSRRRSYDALMDTYLEEGYQAWKTRQRVKGGHAKKKRRRLGDDGELRRAARACVRA